MNQWLTIAVGREVVLRSLKVALVVGILLTLINHGDVIYKEGITGIDANRLLKIVLTFCVPYMVSTYASVSTQVQNVQTKRTSNPNN
ncbi:MAG: hypothetical protein ACI8WB_002821 [Phenylobacterium sp.]|jgi:hypothetical protein